MEKKQISNTHLIRVSVCEETKSTFLAKLRIIECNEANLFLAFLLDVWTKREKISDNLRADSRYRRFKILFSLMPAKVPYNIMKIGDVILIHKYYGLRRSEWIDGIVQAARLSEYNTAQNVCRSLIYAVILAPSKLLEELHSSYIESNIGHTKFKSVCLFRLNINKDIYAKLYDMYGISPSALIYILIKMMLGESAGIRKTLLNNISLTPNKCRVRKGGKALTVEINNDLLRLNVLRLMIDLGFSTKSGFAYALIELAMKVPQLIKDELSLGSYQMDNTDDEYLFERMSNLSYKFNGQ